MRRTARQKASGKEFYKKMLAAKQAKADKAKREKQGPLDEAPKVNPQLPDSPKKRLEVTDISYGKMEENTNTESALTKALNTLRKQAGV